MRTLSRASLSERIQTHQTHNPELIATDLIATESIVTDLIAPDLIVTDLIVTEPIAWKDWPPELLRSVRES
jgi:hypothetical protein